MISVLSLVCLKWQMFIFYAYNSFVPPYIYNYYFYLSQNIKSFSGTTPETIGARNYQAGIYFCTGFEKKKLFASAKQRNEIG